MSKISKPAIFHFQPTSFKTLTTPKELAQWEKDMKDYVGLTIDHKSLSGTCSESTSGGEKDDCDQD